ncbi:MAG: MMPL family transporter [Anaerostipes sp.]|jgi:predicted RND superfamily exporter protein|nr:MMPL family transporter [Anaerostipes sp.]MDD3745880.1 MMPL family transporter [Anaerostipes sp.]
MIRFGKWIAKHKKLIVFIAFLLMIPSVIGMSITRVNYDILSYLPESLETVKGQDVMVKEFGSGAFSMVVVEDMKLKDVEELQHKIEKIDHVSKVIWYGSVSDISVPTDMLPKRIRTALFKDNATLMITMFDDTTSSDTTMNAITEMRNTVNKQCFISGMAGIVTDIKNLVQQEMPIYVAIAGAMSLIVLCLTMESLVVPVLFLLSVGMAILYNLGSNIFLDDVSYLTQALTAILQLGVTMDYSIFLLHSYEEQKERFPEQKERAMAHAISNTFKSVAGSSITTIAGFIALCSMTFKLGANIGIVLSKGVVIGVLCCVTVLPALILVFDKAIEKTKHKSLIPDLSKASHFITRHHKVFIVIFLIMLVPAFYGYQNTGIYYNLDRSLPQSLDSNTANRELDKTFAMSNIHMIMIKGQMSSKDKTDMIHRIEKVKGVKWVLGLDSFIGSSVPSNMLPADLTSTLKNDKYEMQFVCSEYKSATDQVNAQVASINKIVKGYNKDSMVIGEAPLMKDLQDVTDVDLTNVNTVSILAIFVIILCVFKSISLPILLVAVIEFAIFVNMGIPYYMGQELPFVASIVIGTIQLGATVDYAILMTSKYQKLRMKGIEKVKAVREAHESSMLSIITSGLSFFAATFGVAIYSKIDMISAICTLLARGAVISTIVVICILPAMFMIFDKVICRTTIGMNQKKIKKAQEA